MSPRVYSAYSGDILDYIAVFNRKKVSLPFLIPLHAFFFPSFFAEKWSRILYIHRSFQEWILTYKTPSTEACIPRNKRVSPFPPDGYKDLTISNSEGGGWERTLWRKLFRDGSTGRGGGTRRNECCSSPDIVMTVAVNAAAGSRY